MPNAKPQPSAKNEPNPPFEPNSPFEPSAPVGPNAKFDVGQLIHHRLFDYRGVVFDVDPEFQGTEEWYRKAARSEPPRDQPWYHVLVDGGHQTTYVAERNLEPDTQGDEIENPLVGRIFDSLEDGHYVIRNGFN